MRPAPAGTVKVMKPEDKQRALSEFIAATLAQTAPPANAEPAPRTIIATLIAHSPSSPVAKALASLAASDANVTVQARAIFASLDTDGSSAAPVAATWLSSPAGRVTLRQIVDVRLCDAHEQMVVDGASAWVGDCLRRDPSKRDAYETFALADATVQRFAELSFERIWALSEPVAVARPLAGSSDDAAGNGDTPLIDVAPLTVDFAATAMIATRH